MCIFNIYKHKLPFWPKDDIIYFSGMARLMDIPLFVDNTQWYGWFPYPVQSGILQNEIDMFIYTLMEIVTQPPVGWEIMPPASYAIPVAYPEPTKFQKYGVNEIYMINLEYVEINFEEIPENVLLYHARRLSQSGLFLYAV